MSDATIDTTDLPELTETTDPETLEGSNAAPDVPEEDEATRDLPEPEDEGEPAERGMPGRLSKQGAHPGLARCLDDEQVFPHRCLDANLSGAIPGQLALLVT